MASTKSQSQNKAAPDASRASLQAGLLQRKCACGNHTIAGSKCGECRKQHLSLQRAGQSSGLGTRDSEIGTRNLAGPSFVYEGLRSRDQTPENSGRSFPQPRLGHDFSRVRAHSGIQRLQGRPGGRSTGSRGTNYAFDTYGVTEAQLSDPEIAARFTALSRAQLIEYRTRVRDPAVQDYITQLLTTTPSTPCTAAEVSRTNAQAEAGRTASLPWVGAARAALDRLHSAWDSNRADILAGRRTLSGQVVCAFDSNFNINQRDRNYSFHYHWVGFRLRQLESALRRAGPYACQPDDDPNCLGSNRDAVAYVRDGRPPIHFCQQFRSDPDLLSQQATVLHEFAHLCPGVHDQGGYALSGFGAEVMTCQTGSKFRAASDVLTNTADALAGFVLHVGQRGSTDVQVR